MMNTKKLYLIGVVIGLLLAGGIAILVNWTNAPAPVPAARTTQPSAPLADAFANWQTVTPASRLFTVQFPTAPERSTTETPIAGADASLIQEMHVAKDDKGNVYYVATFIYPQPFDLTDPEKILRIALDGMVGAIPGNQLEDSAYGEFKKLPSLEFVIRDQNQHVHQGKLIIKDKVLYQVFVTYDEGNLEENAYQHFLQSFVVPS